MKQWRQTQAARIDAMTLRERAILFLVLIFVVLALADVLWLSPVQATHKQVVQRHSAQGVELTRLRTELATSTQPVDANKAAREELAAATTALQLVMQDIKALAPVGDSGPPLDQVLVQFLRRQPGLTLLGTTTLAPEANTGSASTVTAVIGMNKRGLELRVAGSYAELNRYVKALETALPNLRWGPLVVKKGPQVAEMTLQVFLVGVQP